MSLLYFLFGAVAGSVANAVIYRLPRNIPWWKGRSICPQCKHKLGWQELVPIVSWLWLRGRCKHCKKAIGLRYLVVELVMALVFSGISGISGGYILMAIVFVTVIIAVMDWETQLVSEWLVVIWAVLVVVSSGIGISSVWGAVVGIGVIGGLWGVTRGRGMGFGDVEIAAVMGWWLGWPKVGVALWVAFVGGAGIGVLRVLRGRATMKSHMAFGTFLIIGTWIAYFWGDMIVRWILFRF